MKRKIRLMAGWLGLMVAMGFGRRALAQDPGFRVAGIGSIPIPVTMEKMTNLIFPEAVQIGVKVSSGVLAQKVRGVENVIELKAQRRNFPVTNLSIYGKDGRLYSFVLHYAADSDVLNFRILADTVGGGLVAGVPRVRVMLEGLPVDLGTLRRDAAELAERNGFLHRRVQVYGTVLRLRGIYFRDSLEWVVLEVDNRKQIPLELVYSRFSIGDRRRVKRTAVQESPLVPVFGELVGTIRGRRELRFAVGFKPFSAPRDKRLVVELAAADGRLVLMAVKSKLLLRAKAE